MTKKHTKGPYNVANGNKMYQHLPLQHPPKFTQIGKFGSKKYTIWQPCTLLGTNEDECIGGFRGGWGGALSELSFSLQCAIFSQGERGANVMISIFGEFDQFSAKKSAVFFNKQCYDC
jgi:hypothetical protein